MEWGKSANVKLNNAITITLPTTFSAATSYKVVTTWITNDSSMKHADDNPNITTQAKGSFAAFAGTYGAHDSYNMPFNWIAIGY